MSEDKKAGPKSVSRRDFLKDAGIVLGGAAAGSALLLTGCREEKEVTKTVEVQITVPKASGHIAQISIDETLCTGCGTCELVCATVHGGAVGPNLRRIWLQKEPVALIHSVVTCQQCDYPECYFACPLKDEALCIDEITGIRYINEDKCNGCGECVDACPFDVPRVQIDTSIPIAERKAYKCDLCKDRENGPACVEFCNAQALTFLKGGI
jgi:Fe-S-cluster-containing hydrogenase component 2